MRSICCKTNANGQATGYNNAQISLGGGTVTLAGFGNVDLKSTGQIVATGALQNGTQIVSTANAGALNVQAPLTLDAPRIGGGVMTTDPTTGLPKLDTATIGGGDITLSSTSGAIAIQSGAVLDVGDLADVGALNQTNAGTLTLRAPVGGVTIAGSLLGQGPTPTAAAPSCSIPTRSRLARR
jgi:hypothetical protein